MRSRIVSCGETRVPLSKIALGTGDYGTGRPEPEAFAQMDAYYAAGGRTLDTARVYGAWAPGGDGASETCVGKWLRERGVRGEMVISTKGAHPPLGHMSQSRLRPECIARDLSESLAFLDTAYVDVYFLHRDDPSVPVSEIIDALDEHVRAGRIRLLGASNWTHDRIMEANAYARSHGRAPFSLSQIEWSYAVLTCPPDPNDTLVYMTEQEYRNYREEPVALMAYTSQARGFFNKLAAGGEEALPEALRRVYLCEENLRRAERLAVLANKKDATLAQLALAYITWDPLDGVAIISARTQAQLEDSLASERLQLTPEEWAYLDAGTK